jgi:hypothetical protein
MTIVQFGGNNGYRGKRGSAKILPKGNISVIKCLIPLIRPSQDSRQAFQPNEKIRSLLTRPYLSLRKRCLSPRINNNILDRDMRDFRAFERKPLARMLSLARGI